MAAGKSNRARSKRASARPSQGRPRREVRVREALDEALGQFNEALALLETTYAAFEASEVQDHSSTLGAHTIALRLVVGVLKRVYDGFDVAILKVKT
jgi:hypothetical protein